MPNIMKSQSKKHKEKRINIIIFASMLIITSFAVASGLITSNNPCKECHRLFYEYCNLLPDDTLSTLPETINEEPTYVKIAVEITGNGKTQFYKIDLLQVRLESKNGLVNIQNSEQEMHDLYPGSKIVFSWTVRGIENGTDTLVFNLYAHNPHKDSEFYDSFSYDVTVSISSDNDKPQKPAVEPSSWTVVMDENGEGEVVLHINREIEDLVINTPNFIQVKPDYVPTLSAGENITLFFEAKTNQKINANVSVYWRENGEQKEIKLLVLYNPPSKAGGNPYSLVGRYTGIASLALLIISILFGGVSNKLKHFLNSKMGARKRIRMHCIISWALLILSLIHGAILLIGPYSNYFWDPKIVLGDLSALSLLAISINGTFMKSIIRRIGADRWRKMHIIYSWISLVLCIVHTILIGTDFAFIRNVLRK